MTTPSNELLSALARWTDGSGPLHARLSNALRIALDRGEIAAGDRIPPERALSRALGISRNTVVAAYDTLRAEGLLVSRQGSGTFAASAPFADGPAPALPAASVSIRSALLVGLPSATGAIEFTGASIPADPIVTPAVLAEARETLEGVLRTSGYLPAGLPLLRSAVASHLTERGLATRPEEVLITSGAQQAISLAASLLVRPGDRVAIENPGYTGTLDVLRTRGASLAGIGVDASGARVDSLAAVVRSSPAAVFLTPTFQSPTGALLPDARRREIARLADSMQVALVEDDALGETSLDGTPLPPPIAAYVRRAPTLTIGSLSKTLWGGLRVGWIRAPEPVIERLTRLRVAADHSGSLIGQGLALHLFPRLAKIRELRREHATAQRSILRDLLAEHLPTWTSNEPRGGMLLWVRLPHGSAAEFVHVAARHAVVVVPGTVASCDSTMDEFLRIPFTLDPAAMRDGVERLARAWSSYEASTMSRGEVRVIV